MSTLVIIGSTTFAPLSQVEDYLRERETWRVITWGTSPVADCVLAVRPDAVRLDATPGRDELIAAGREPRTMIVAFTAIDPDTKTITGGTRDNINLLQTNGIDVVEVESTLTPSQAALYHVIESRLNKIASGTGRRDFHIKRVIEDSERLRAMRTELEETLDREDRRMRDEKVPNDSPENDRWIRNLNRGVTMSKLLWRVEAIQGETKVAA
jgi:hypothetical protein